MPFPTLPNIEDFGPSDNEDIPADASPVVSKPNVGVGLARLMLEAGMTRRQRTLDRKSARVMVIQAPSATWSEFIGAVLQEKDTASIYVVTERKRQPSQSALGGNHLTKLELGRSLVFVTPDPGFLDTAVLGAADETIAIPRPNTSMVRKIINRTTDTVARGLVVADLAGLDAPDIVAAIRPGSTAGDCISRLRRASALKATPRDTTPVLRLESLPLTRTVSDWATDILEVMRRVDGGSALPDKLRFAVLEGPPGTGKTTIAASLARSSGWAFVPTSCGEWFSGSDGALGGVARAAKTFFDGLTAQDGPVVGFIDELDSLPDRASLDSKEASWWTPVVNLILTEIDTVRRSGRPILLLAATNHYLRLDAALVRPGRLERRVPVLLPNEDERKSTFRHYLPNDMLPDDSLAIAARLALDATPAKIEACVLSALAAAEAAGRAVGLDDLIKALAPADNRPHELIWAVCLHEAGHAVAALELGLPLVDISILPSGNAAGWTRTDLNGLLMTRSDVERIVVILLAGRAADLIVGSGANAGARSDLEAANRLIADSILGGGLYGTLQTAETASRAERLHDGRTLSRAIADELDRLMQMSATLIERRREDVVGLAEHLRRERVIPGARVHALVGAKSDIQTRTRSQHHDEQPRMK